MDKVPGGGGGGGGLPYETDRDASRLSSERKFWILVSLKVLRAKLQYLLPPKFRLGFSKETRETEVKFS